MGLFHKTLDDAKVALMSDNMNFFSNIIEKHLRDEFALNRDMKQLMQLLDSYEEALRNAASMAKKGIGYQHECGFHLRVAKDSIEAFEMRIKRKIEQEAKALK